MLELSEQIKILKKFYLIRKKIMKTALDALKSAESVWIKTFHYNKDKKDLFELEKFLKNNI